MKQQQQVGVEPNKLKETIWRDNPEDKKPEAIAQVTLAEPQEAVEAVEAGEFQGISGTS